MTEIIFYTYDIFDSSLNMAIDEYFLKSGDGLVMRLYDWKPATVTIGKSQKVDTAYNREFCHKKGIPAVKRSTGGAAVYHKNEITYMFSAPLNFFSDSSVTGTYKEIAEIFLGVFKDLEIPCDFAGTVNRKDRIDGLRNGIACFLLPSDFEILADGRKIIGNAQKREGGRIVQHGSIAFDFDFEETAHVLNCDLNWLKNKVTCVKEYKKELKKEDFQQSLIQRLESMNFSVIRRSNPLDDIPDELIEELLKKFPII